MRDYKQEFESRVNFIRELLAASGAKGIVFGNSGGKDCALVGILCKAACENTLGLILPCSSRRNYELDANDGRALADKFHIETRLLDVSPVKEALLAQLAGVTEVSHMADVNIAPRLRMTALYAIAASENRLVAGTGNRSEAYVGYYTKWGDGAHDFNPISDLTVREVYEFLRYLGAPACIIEKAPSAGLFDGQTDEQEMGFKYADLDEFLLTGSTNDKALDIIRRMHQGSAHKRAPIKTYENSI